MTDRTDDRVAVRFTPEQCEAIAHLKAFRDLVPRTLPAELTALVLDVAEHLLGLYLSRLPEGLRVIDGGANGHNDGECS